MRMYVFVAFYWTEPLIKLNSIQTLSISSYIFYNRKKVMETNNITPLRYKRQLVEKVCEGKRKKGNKKKRKLKVEQVYTAIYTHTPHKYAYTCMYV